jgi:hypothetical protein
MGLAVGIFAASLFVIATERECALFLFYRPQLRAVAGRSRHRGLLFYRLIEGALAADPHPYTTLLAQRQAA